MKAHSKPNNMKDHINRASDILLRMVTKDRKKNISKLKPIDTLDKQTLKNVEKIFDKNLQEVLKLQTVQAGLHRFRKKIDSMNKHKRS